MGDGCSECVLSHGGLICVSWAQGSSLWFLLLFIRNIILCSSAAGSSRGLCWIMHIHRVTRLNRTFSFFLPCIGHRDPVSDCPSHYIWKCCCLWKFIHVFLLAPSFSILQTWWLEKPKRTDTQDAQAEINIYTVCIYQLRLLIFYNRHWMCQWREQQTQENVCAARKPLFNHHFFWDFLLQRLDSQYYHETNYNWPPSSLQSLVKIFLKKALNYKTNSVDTEENIDTITV